MRYTYAYKTSDGKRHEAAIEAKSREDAFAELRKRGVKPIKVVAADGSKANGEIRGVRKRFAAAVSVLVAAVVGVIAFFIGESNNRTVGQQDKSLSSPRHQIYGDPVIMEELERGVFDKALHREGDRLLAWFAEPGRLMCPKTADPRRLSVQQAEVLAAYVKTELSVDHDLKFASEEAREYRELKQIVNGMRHELRNYLANGNGTPRSFWRRLVERTQQEMQIYERTRRELENEKSPEVWGRKNRELRRIGLRTITSGLEQEEDD